MIEEARSSIRDLIRPFGNAVEFAEDGGRRLLLILLAAVDQMQTYDGLATIAMLVNALCQDLRVTVLVGELDHSKILRGLSVLKHDGKIDMITAEEWASGPAGLGSALERIFAGQAQRHR